MAHRTSTLLIDERGATAVEYGLIVSLIVIAMIGALLQVAGTTTEMWNNVSDAVVDASQ
ncbi:Flp family type IVb pilin [Sphingosinicella humi]|uniref:Flp family type IVb pilin n=1 Tax=Allosphingosinicella humi TaxID=2068657 RepID=A0A2U2J5H6_9SPHN|nr:Flp family type IVb pilin [Sphingosinicella humi]PWG03593.1 Flp family type IVb pilin [Sphingosinicella humi]